MVHRILDVVADLVCHRAEAGRYEELESAHQPVIVEHYEYDIQEDYEPCHNSENHMHSTVDDCHPLVDDAA